MIDNKAILNKMLNEVYYSSKELLYSSNPGFLLTPYEYKEFLNYKDELIKQDDPLLINSGLKTFNGGYIHYSNANDLKVLKEQYLKTILLDNASTFSFHLTDEITRSRIYSEVEGSLNIESVPTTRKAIDDFANNKRDPKTLNDQIIKNMIDGIKFVNELPEFNKDNLLKLYNILSKGCLDDKYKLHDNEYYRYDEVEVGGYSGCPSNKINECMDSLFEFVNNNIKNGLPFMSDLPHIAHYYLVYIHPYFDYNGRTARMVSYWISLLSNGRIVPPIVSEAINQTKNKYYLALSESRDNHNDLTYFLIYIYQISIKYIQTYIDIEYLGSNLQNQNIVLTNLEKTYIKKILISSNGKFTYNDFVSWINIDMTKQGALKILNTLESYGILKSEMSKSNKKLFYINKNCL